MNIHLSNECIKNQHKYVIWGDYSTLMRIYFEISLAR